MMAFDIECRFNKKYGLLTRKILRALSENSRVTLSELEAQLGVSRRTLAKRLKLIEKEFGIRYTLDISKRKIGLNNPHLILVKLRKKARRAELEEFIRGSYVPQLIVPIKGTYDMLIYANAASFKDYMDWDRGARRKLMIKYGMRWEHSQVVFTRLGFIPLRDEAIEHSKIPEGDKKMLVLLNGNSRMQCKELAKMLNLNYKTCIYRFNSLVKHKYIRRFTISMDKPKDVSLMSYFVRYIPTDESGKAKSYSQMMFASDEQNSLVSRYALKMSLIGSYDSFALGAFDNAGMGRKHLVRAYKELFGRFSPIKSEYGELQKPLLGRLPIRSMDIKIEYYSKSRSRNVEAAGAA